jgi:hypothetical protein
MFNSMASHSAPWWSRPSQLLSIRAMRCIHGCWWSVFSSTAKEQHMASLGKAIFKGGSGKPYRFKIYPMGTRFRKISGIYVIANRSHDVSGGYQHKILYVGHTEDFSQPFAEHHKAKDFADHGANCICLQADNSDQSRVEKERDLVSAFNPACND